LSAAGAKHDPLIIRPSAPEWGDALRAGPVQRPRPIIMTGHQPLFWHPGILAKYLAADAAARKWGGETTWLVVDQGRPATVELRYPARVAGRLVSKSVLFGGNGDPAVPDDAAVPCVRDGLARIIAAMNAARGERTLSRRVGRALQTLLSPMMAAPARTLYATELWELPAFTGLVSRMTADPEHCVRAYNAAVAHHPSAGMRPLIADDIQDRWELPLWWLPREGPRRRVYAEDLRNIPRDELAPRALLVTGMLRMSECSIFIHGTGGGGSDDEHEGYDTVTEEWLRQWIGTTALAPLAVVTATKHLPLGVKSCPGAAEVATAKWRAHSARHHPAMLGEPTNESVKATHVAAIKSSRDRHARDASFRAMHHILDEYRARRVQDLSGLEYAAAEVEGQKADAAIASDRTWPFPLYPPEALQDLKRRIDRAFGVA
jgi:hypothetical protein